ncbi:GNAT family N-acetyltransferase [Aquihabitans sp. G128]|uniref:GNAT family N-acetyltransferase n=1 Tax=Aquihabitans sp. G128 TaxID=2849779 RepID=UPI001C224A3E|nr:GNAT family N-acetyltransferase [Aquihabitans sp. G128]QXC59878.1 GNAT family N-acetyltransferase [Aquihabitans sp. G128]
MGEPTRPSVPEGYEVRDATVGDLPQLGPIEVAAGELFRTVGMDDVAGDEGFPLADLEAARADGRLWVVACDGRAVGYVLALDLPGQAHLEQLSVDPAHGRRGLGAALVERVATWARERGAADLTLSTFRDVAWNRPYYERLGFAVVPEVELSATLREVRAHEAAIGLDVDARVVMRRPLL